MSNLNVCRASTMMAFQVNAKALLSQGSSSCSQRGPDAAGYPIYRSFGMRSGGGQAPFRPNNYIRTKFPVIPPLSRSRDGGAVVSGLVVGGSPMLAKVDKLQSHNSDLVKDICGRDFLYDKQCARLDRARTVIPPLPREYHVKRPGNLHPFRLSKELSHSHAGQPFTLGYPERYELNINPAVLYPPTSFLNSRNTFSVENCKLSRPKVNYPTYNLMTVKDNQKTSCNTDQSYPDPMLKASRSFIQRISELSSLEGETVRQEKLKKMKKGRKPPS